MIARTLPLGLAAALALAASPIAAASEQSPGLMAIATLDKDAAATYRAIFDQLDSKKWDDARTAILALDETDSMRAYLLARLYLAKDSPRVALFDLLEILNKSPYLPQTDQLGRLAMKRGAQVLPDQPESRKLVWMGGSPQRRTLGSTKDDPAADALREQVRTLIVADDPAGAEALLNDSDEDLTAEGRTELLRRIAWSYYLVGDMQGARRTASGAIEGGAGDSISTAWWTIGLAAWRQQDWNGAAQAFYQAGRSATEGDMRSSGYFWSARATMANGHPEDVNPLLQAAAREGETFYGLLARETLGMPSHPAQRSAAVTPSDWRELAALPNARNAVIMASLGRAGDADLSLRREADISGDRYYAALVHLAGELNLPNTQLWLAQRSANGERAGVYARFPSPGWTPANGWQVDKALVFAHALQETRFQADARSPADARGLLQVVPGTGRELAAEAGLGFSVDQLYDPSFNMALAQLYMRKLSNMPATQGLLLKVVAAYNAGPTPVDRWNIQVRDDGDPLLFIESVPYYETRAYLNAVLRNYFIYQMEQEGSSPVLTAMAQGMWTRFPDGKKTVAIRKLPSGRVASAD